MRKFLFVFSNKVMWEIHLSEGSLLPNIAQSLAHSNSFTAHQKMHIGVKCGTSLLVIYHLLLFRHSRKVRVSTFKILTFQSQSVVNSAGGWKIICKKQVTTVYSPLYKQQKTVLIISIHVLLQACYLCSSERLLYCYLVFKIKFSLVNYDIGRL